MNDTQQPGGERHGLEDQLVSYLDGELEAAEARRVEEALAADPRVRQELRELERSWALLDELPRTQVDESFTRSTVEMIAVKAEEDLAAVQASLPQRQRRAWTVVGGTVALAALAGFAAVTFLANRSDEQLLRDLPVIEHLDQYRAVEDIEFLRSLRSRSFPMPDGRGDERVEVKHDN